MQAFKAVDDSPSHSTKHLGSRFPLVAGISSLRSTATPRFFSFFFFFFFFCPRSCCATYRCPSQLRRSVWVTLLWEAARNLAPCGSGFLIALVVWLGFLGCEVGVVLTRLAFRICLTQGLSERLARRSPRSFVLDLKRFKKRFFFTK